MTITPNNQNPPGGIYLCQCDDDFSCGACCGLYNVATPTYSYLSKILAERTNRFLKVERHMEGIESFGLETVKQEKNKPPFKDFHHCPYIGFIDNRDRQVGCLLHPLSRGNGGIDFRGLSEYGGWACRSYFCPSYKELPTRWKEIFKGISQNWYEYGAMITESNLIRSFLQLTEERLERQLKIGMIVDNTAIVAALKDFLHLKWQWPFRFKHFPAITHYFFKTPETYHRPPIRRHVDANLPLHPTYEVIFRELVSEFPSERELVEAISIIDNILNRILNACPR